VDFDVTGQLLITHSALDTGKETVYETVHRLFIDFEKAYDSVRREVLYNSLTEFGVCTTIFRLIKMYFKEIYSEICTDKNLYTAFSFQNGI
jgi:hypothetical protein